MPEQMFDLPKEGCETGIVAPDVPCATSNLLIQALDTMVHRMIQELTKAQSGRVTGLKAADYERYIAYFKKLKSITTTFGGDVGIDSHFLIQLQLSDIGSLLVRTENDMINLAVNYLTSAVITLRISQSSRMNDGLLPQDREDFLEAVRKAEDVLVQAYQEGNPLDMPQSTPRDSVLHPTGGPTTQS